MATTTRTCPVLLYFLGALSAAVSGPPRRDAELHLTPLCHLEHSKPALYTRGKKLVKLIDIEASSSEVADCARFALSRADDGWSADGHWASNSKRNNTWKYVATSQLRQVHWRLTDVVSKLQEYVRDGVRSADTPAMQPFVPA